MATEALHGITVIDASTLFAGPLAATILGDFGADVLKIEHPRMPDPSRAHGPSKDGIGLWWKMLGRNKQPLTLDFGAARMREVLDPLIAGADVFIENFRPGTLEKWGIGPDDLWEINPRLVIARVTGFGQFGPMSTQPGFGTLAESMSGFAAVNGDPDGPPLLPPFGLADGVTALSLATAILTALHARATSGRGQVIDIAIIEPMLTLLGPQATAFDQLGYKQPRSGNRSTNNAPRNVYRSRDDVWLSVSTSATSIARRVLTLVGRPDIAAEPWFETGHGRVEHADMLDALVAEWIAERDAAEVLAAFREAQAAIAPVYDIEGIFDDPQYRALDTVTRVEDPDFGTVRMPNVLYRLSDSPGRIRWTGRAHGADTDQILRDRLGMDEEHIASLRKDGTL